MSKYNKIVFTNGCFDILHPGHLKVLETCYRKASYGEGVVIVGLNSDVSIRRLKGPGRPILNEFDRKILLCSIKYVNEVVIFDEDTPLEIIKSVRPDVIVKGGDYDVNEIVGADLVEEVVVVPYDNNWSTTKIIEKIRKFS